MNRIPIGDFPLGSEEWEAVKRVFDSGRLTEGFEVRAFEDEFAAYMGTRHCVAVSSGTAALMVGLRALGVSKQFPFTLGARVLVPALTFIATANAVELAGFRVMFGDISPETMCLDPAEIARTRTEVVLPVHLMGYGADMETIIAECTKHQRVLCEDASEAHGTTIDGQRAGTFGAWGAFSFYPAHTVQAGELGCIVTNSAEVARIARQLKAHGRECHCRICTRNTTGCPQIQAGGPDPRFRAQYVGWNFKPQEIPAALARVQLKHIEENILARGAWGFILRAELFELVESEAIEPFILQPDSVPMAFPIILKKSGYRDRVVSELERRGVEARPLFGCIPTQQPAFAGTWNEPRMKAVYEGRGLSVAEHYGADGFYVGCHQYLTAEQVDRMAGIIRDVIAEVVT
ncbi:MAG TPA: DegT/DnrJ/EryC1/StrS family aminotransferase [Anaerolineae bacterium]|nr:DegT/DnrJ/EryC1/StrS family aminotransferase [Anaerolineae bacterium]